MQSGRNLWSILSMDAWLVVTERVVGVLMTWLSTSDLAQVVEPVDHDWLRMTLASKLDLPRCASWAAIIDKVENLKRFHQAQQWRCSDG